MEYIDPAESWTKLLENFIKKCVLVILNKRMNLNKTAAKSSINTEV